MFTQSVAMPGPLFPSLFFREITDESMQLEALMVFT